MPIIVLSPVTSAMRGVMLAIAVLGAATVSADARADSETLADLAKRTHFHGLAVDPVGPDRLYLATHHGLFLVTMDGTAAPLSPVQDFMGFTPHPTTPSILFASGHPAAGGNLGVVMSADGGAHWTQISPGLDGPVDFHQMDVSAADPRVVYGNYKGIQVSRDGGKNWVMAGPAPGGLIDFAASTRSAELLFAATQVGLFVSEDSGAVWRPIAFGGAVVSAVARGPAGTVFAFVVGQGLFLAKEDDLGNWTLLSGDFGERIPIHLAFDAQDPQRIFVATQTNDILASGDGGKTWIKIGAQ